ncbi:MAG: hypothetical protein LQ338_008115 [Usnochroma carphineum]|nr:MAG: hypothetical protein LQ338_008115 [Usnochroma carphineum]
MLAQNPELQALARKSDLNSYLGPDAHAITYQLQRGRTFNLVVVASDDLPDDCFVTTAPFEEVEDRLQDWDPRFIHLFSLTPDSILKWKLCTSPPVSSWVHPTGHAVLLGDAAHASLPGQGAASALEDAAVLGALFSQLTHKSQTPTLLERYEALRKPRATTLVEKSAAMRDFNHVNDGQEQVARDMEMKDGRPAKGWRNVYCEPDFQQWMFGTDVVRETEGAGQATQL